MARTKKLTYAEISQQLKEQEHKNLMLTHYAMDLRSQVKPSAIAEEEGQKVELYRPLAAYRGYYIISQDQKYFDILSLEQAENWYKGISLDSPLRLALGRVIEEHKKMFRREIIA